mgnify:CR=1 FL=1
MIKAAGFLILIALAGCSSTPNAKLPAAELEAMAAQACLNINLRSEYFLCTYEYLKEIPDHAIAIRSNGLLALSNNWRDFEAGIKSRRRAYANHEMIIEQISYKLRNDPSVMTSERRLINDDIYNFNIDCETEGNSLLCK